MILYCAACIDRWGKIQRGEWNVANTIIDGTALCASCLDRMKREV